MVGHRGAKRQIAKILRDGKSLTILKNEILSPDEIAKGMRKNGQGDGVDASQAPALAYIAVMIKEYGGILHIIRREVFQSHLPFFTFSSQPFLPPRLCMRTPSI